MFLRLRLSLNLLLRLGSLDSHATPHLALVQAQELAVTLAVVQDDLRVDVIQASIYRLQTTRLSDIAALIQRVAGYQTLINCVSSLRLWLVGRVWRAANKATCIGHLNLVLGCGYHLADADMTR